MGRKPLPTKIKAMKGTLRKHREKGKSVVTTGTLDPTPPEFLDDVGRAEWNRIAPQLITTGIVTFSDAAILAAYCETFSRYISAVKDARENPAVIFTEKGFPIQSPYVGILNKALSELRACAAELGITPSSRSKVAPVGDKEKKNPFAEF